MNLKSFNISSYIYNIFSIFYKHNFKGWGRKKTGIFALWCHKTFGGSLTLQEDGFIRSRALGIEGSPSWSLVEDDVGIYYDATTPSKLENIYNNYDFALDNPLMEDAYRAIELIQNHNISKYNNYSNVDSEFRKKHNLEARASNILIIAQTDGDASLKYGMLDNFTTDDMINQAIDENPNSKIYLKVHPDVLSGKKSSDIDISLAKKKCIIIEENVNPLSLLKEFSKVYTKTSQMGFEALLVGCECVCFGMPFYASWGVTEDKSICKRRKKELSKEEIFAGAYILYTKYRNPDTKKKSGLFEVIEYMAKKHS